MRSIHAPAYKRLVGLLREARLSSGLSQVEVSTRLGRPQSFVSACESGQRRIDLIELSEFAKLYGVPVSSFLKALDG